MAKRVERPTSGPVERVAYALEPSVHFESSLVVSLRHLIFALAQAPMGRFSGKCDGVGRNWTGPAGSKASVEVVNKGKCDLTVSLKVANAEVGKIVVRPEKSGDISTEADTVTITCATGDAAEGGCSYESRVTFS